MIYIMQMELVASPCAQVSAITSDLWYMYSIYSLSSSIVMLTDVQYEYVLLGSHFVGGGGRR